MAIGDWVGLYGSAGYWLPGGALRGGSFTTGSASDDVSSGLGAGITSACSRSIWEGLSSNDRALQTPDGTARVATIAWVDVMTGSFTVDLAFPDWFDGTVHVYYAGWDRTRPMRLTLGTDVQESGFDDGLDGRWFHFTDVVAAPGATMTLTVEALGGYQPLIDGIFFDSTGVVIAPGAIGSSETLGAPEILGGTLTLTPSAIPAGAALGAPRVLGGTLRVTPSAIPSGEAFDELALLTTASPTILPAGIPSTWALGAPDVAVAGPATLTLAAIAAAAAVGTPFILNDEIPFAVPRNRLIDRSTGEVYPWPVNHATEDAIKTIGRRLARSGISPHGFLIRQPTHPGPVHLALHGSLLDRDLGQYHAFVRFFDECDDRQLDYIDAAGDSYRIIITQFDAQRKMSPARLDGSYFTYTLDVEVLAVNGGALKGYVA